MLFVKRSFTLVAAGLFIVSCGTDPEPSKGNNTTPPNNTMNPNNTNNNTTPPINTNNPPNNTNNPPNNTNNPPNNTNNPVACSLLTNFYGQIGGSGPSDGGAPTLDGLDYDANLTAVYAAVPTTQDNPDTPNVDEGRADNLDIQVTGALVTATYGGNVSNTRFFLQDQDSVIRVFLDQGEQQTTAIKVGQRLSFTVTATRNFGGTPQIAKLSNLTVDSEGNSVPYSDATGTDLTIDDFGRIVRVFGVITAENGDCGGGNTCYTLDHGDNKSVILRSRSDFLAVNQCVTFAGPASAFPGPLADGNKTIQLDQTNFGWLNELR